MTNNWLINWKADLDQIALELPQRHKNLFFSCTKNDFERQIDELKGNLEQFDNFMIAVHIAKIVASIKDAHTALMMPAMRFIPLEFYWFEEGLYVVAASREHESEMHARIMHINKTPIDDVIQRIAEIVARENPSFLKAQLPKYLSSAEVLYGLEIIDDFDKIELTMEGLDGKVRSVMTDTCPSSDFHRSMPGPDNFWRKFGAS